MGAQDAAGAMFGPPAMGITAAKDAVELRSKGTPGAPRPLLIWLKIPIRMR